GRTGPSLVECGTGPGGSTHERSKPKLVMSSTFAGPPVMVPAPRWISTVSLSPMLLMIAAPGYEMSMKPLHSSVAWARPASNSTPAIVMHSHDPGWDRRDAGSVTSLSVRG